MFLLRIHCGSDTSNLKLRACPRYEALITMLKNLFGLPATSIEYQDEEGDMVAVSCQLELDEAVRIATTTERREEDRTLLELFIDRTVRISSYQLHVSVVLSVEEEKDTEVTDELPETDGLFNSKILDGLENDWILSAPFSCSTIVNDITEHEYSQALPGDAAETDLKLLSEMGFVDVKENLHMLLKYKGDIAAVVEALIKSKK